MSVTPLKSRVVVLVKALPQPSKTYGETVCCAGVTAEGTWKRLFPVRFRHLKDRSSFTRWHWISFQYRRPTHDVRRESCHVFEDTIIREGELHERERSRLLEPILFASASAAAAAGLSLALVRPIESRFSFLPKKRSLIDAERDAYKHVARQSSFLDKELEQIEPSPYVFRFRFKDKDGVHSYQSGDWETHAMFWKWRESYGESSALKRMSEVYNDEYPKRGMAFAIGNQAKRPQVWQLLGVLRLDVDHQFDMFRDSPHASRGGA